ncbi:MAG TPA: hypothetical protein VGE44_11870 [Daejeonella sp.]|uniref:hypothetical protein n=1 Tax=Daejeonella sp. TaxID=2805397 RepID=UPI002ED8EE01
MAKKKNSMGGNQPGTMADQKTFQDFNNRKPSLSDPNEIKSKLNPEDSAQPEQSGTPVPDQRIELLKTVPGAPKSSLKKDK